MNIVINAVLSYAKPRGVGRYINTLLPEIAKIDKENNYFVYYGKWQSEYSFLKINQPNFKFIELGIKRDVIRRNYFLAVKLPRIIKKHNPDIFFLIDTQAILHKPCKVVSTIHDLAEYDMKEKYSFIQRTVRKIIVRRQTRLSDAIITVSEYSKNSMIKRFKNVKDKITVIYNSLFSTPVTKIAEKEKYFLFVSETERAKNLSLLIKAFGLLNKEKKEEYKIKVVGNNGNEYGYDLELIDELGLKNQVEFYGYLSDKELFEIYQKAYAFVFPSLFEGFGLPVLEAMSQGVAVLCSDSSSIPEVGGDAVLTFNPKDYAGLSALMNKLINEPSLVEKMSGDGLKRCSLFTADKMAEKTLKVIKEVNEGRKN